MIAARIILLLVIALTTTSCSEHEVAVRRGAFAFHYSATLTEEQIDWYSRFDILVTHDPLPRDQVERLHDAGTKLVLYEWAVAFYDSLATPWQRSLLNDRRTNLLNTTVLTGELGAANAGAWYFDPASEAHEEERAAEIARRIDAANYDGVFLDTTTFASVHSAAREEYERRHGETPYDVAFARFLSRLRRTIPRGIIFTNQGYRSAEHYLPYADWDLTESLVTRPGGGGFEVRPWNDRDDPWNSTSFLMRKLIAPAAARYPSVRFAHLNYVHEPSSETIRLVVATAQLFGGEGFVASPAIAGEKDDMYFRDPGRPLSALTDAAEGDVVYRIFENGVIAISAARESTRIENDRSAGVRNRVTGELTCGRTIMLPPSAGAPQAYFFDNSSDCR